MLDTELEQILFFIISWSGLGVGIGVGIRIYDVLISQVFKKKPLWKIKIYGEESSNV